MPTQDFTIEEEKIIKEDFEEQQRYETEGFDKENFYCSDCGGRVYSSIEVGEYPGQNFKVYVCSSCGANWSD